MAHDVLITGGSGFIGRRLAQRFRAMGHTVVIVARNLDALRRAALTAGCDWAPVDVARIDTVNDALRRFKPTTIVHAAASKFVDVAEQHPLECIDANVVGSQNVARAALEHRCKAVIGVSTDKAAPPNRGTYSLSKALMERLFCSLDCPETRFTCARFGNVAWSTGSVLPLWREMTASSNHVLTTAGPHVTRYMFTVDEAVDLIVDALDNVVSYGGGTIVRNMPCVNVRSLLEEWAAVTGCSWTRGNPRPGDQGHERLIGDVELPFTRSLGGEPITYLITPGTRAGANALVDHPPITIADKDGMLRLIRAGQDEQ